MATAGEVQVVVDAMVADAFKELEKLKSKLNDLENTASTDWERNWKASERR